MHWARLRKKMASCGHAKGDLGGVGEATGASADERREFRGAVIRRALDAERHRVAIAFPTPLAVTSHSADGAATVPTGRERQTLDAKKSGARRARAMQNGLQKTHTRACGRKSWGERKQTRKRSDETLSEREKTRKKDASPR